MFVNRSGKQFASENPITITLIRHAFVTNLSFNELTAQSGMTSLTSWDATGTLKKMSFHKTSGEQGWGLDTHRHVAWILFTLVLLRHPDGGRRPPRS